MPRFVSVHVTSCMTRQDVDRLVRRFFQDTSGDVRCLRVQCDTVAGRMVCEWEGPDSDTIKNWLVAKNVRFRGTEEWLMRVQMESTDGTLTTP